MSGTIFETHTDDRGNVSVRVSRKVQVLTREEADRIAAEYKRMQAENAKLRELVRHMYECMGNIDADGNQECYSCEYDNEEGGCDFERLMRELGVDA